MSYQLSPWDLSDLLPDTEESTVAAATERLQAAVEAVEATRDSLSAEMDTAVFKDVLAKFETVTREAYRLSAYADLWFTADTQSQDALSFKSQIDQLMLDVQNRTLFLSLWWK